MDSLSRYRHAVRRSLFQGSRGARGRACTRPCRGAVLRRRARHGRAELKRECTYTIEGGFPTARFWTLYAADQSLSVVETGKSRLAALQSYGVVRQPDNSVIISAGHHPMPGNWLLTDGFGRMYFVLTFYDTPIASSTGLSDVSLPRIVKVGCDA